MPTRANIFSVFSHGCASLCFWLHVMGNFLYSLTLQILPDWQQESQPSATLTLAEHGTLWGDESAQHCFLLSVFSTVQFVHYLQMGVYLEKVGLWVYVWKSPGRRKHVSFSLEKRIRVDLGRCPNILFLLLSLSYYHMIIIEHTQGTVPFPASLWL